MVDGTEQLKTALKRYEYLKKLLKEMQKDETTANDPRKVGAVVKVSGELDKVQGLIIRIKNSYKENKSKKEDDLLVRILNGEFVNKETPQQVNN